jgi:hypothetical protein
MNVFDRGIGGVYGVSRPYAVGTYCNSQGTTGGTETGTEQGASTSAKPPHLVWLEAWVSKVFILDSKLALNKNAATFP